ncbi:hypothetical protein [Lysinibacillus fusiformis]|uniref:hypothetical protein n=1 Tax=Lysinibacillus fusiformis TaxID=28031 RepID=UPI000D3338C9|nr:MULTISPECIES: hypothetical protein [Lysinibacillus]MED4669878.1 hypothetical protein [Lysinibacillus fusiformis]QAS55637.1 hypothetical protein LSP_04155 [Lysinibacillus sphaericus]RDV30113.1 hypothetical protein C7B90_15880 [Lysinibacillus fusiformis]GED64145.1 hypothetical protein LFU01_25970 [Lysinibacillus fusiformis]
MSKIPVYIKLLIGIGMIIILTSLFLLKDHPYYLWLRWIGNILLIVGIVRIPFTKETDKKQVNI